MDEAPPIGEPGTTTTVWTVGHSTRSIEDFLAVLRAHAISTLVDIRTVPASRRHPQFARAALARSIEEFGLRYEWMGDSLGGLRRPKPDSRHVALRVEGFRGYADYMETGAFRDGVDALLATAREGRSAVLCAEAVWWRCHRSMLADYLTLLRDARVFHAIDASPAKPHAPRAEARVEGDRLVYDQVVPRARARGVGGASEDLFAPPPVTPPEPAAPSDRRRRGRGPSFD